ncbi:MAG: universal stress protein [Pseudomonadota bacterium]
MIRKILVPVRGDGKGDNVLAHAAAMSRRFNAHTVVTYCKARPEDMLPYGVPIPSFVRDQIAEQAEKVADSEEENLKSEFTALAGKLGLTISDKPDGKKPTASWVARVGKQIDVIRHYGRLTDLIAVPQPDRDRNLGANTLKSALFSTGRPVMMCPPQDEAPTSLGEKITIAWNGSTQAARAVALSLNVIDDAKEVTILTVGREEIHGSTSEDLIEYLALRDIEAKVERFESKGKIGSDLLEKSAEVGADLMVMGAYSHSHAHETVFGGSTQVVVDTARMPVLLVH